MSFVKKMAFSVGMVGVGVATALQAQAFVLSENETFRAEIQTAIARAKDFERTQRKWAVEREGRQHGADAVAKRREKEAEVEEKSRAKYVIKRASLPDPAILDEKREKLREKEVAKEEAKMEAARKKYVHKREEVRHVLESKAYIDEAKEYGLTPPEWKNVVKKESRSAD